MGTEHVLGAGGHQLAMGGAADICSACAGATPFWQQISTSKTGTGNMNPLFSSFSGWTLWVIFVTFYTGSPYCLFKVHPYSRLWL